MTEREKKLLSQQLKMQADALTRQSDPEGALSMISVCNALLVSVVCEESLDQMEEAAFERLCAQFFQLSAKAEHFFEMAGKRIGKKYETPGYKAALHQLQVSRETMERLRRKWEDTQRQLRNFKHLEMEKTARLTEAKAELETAREEYSAVQNLLEEYSPEKIQAQREENDRLLSQFTDASAELAQLKQERDQHREDLERIREEIASLPEENHAMLCAYEEKAGLLERLRTVKTNCGPDIQAEMQREIEALSPVVEEYQQMVQLLEGRLTDLKTQQTQYDQKRQTLSTNILALLDQSMADLQQALNDHQEKLHQVQTMADNFSKSMMECLSLRQRYADWLDTDNTPLEALIAALGHTETEELRKTLNPAEIQRVRVLRSEIEERLVRLDDIVKACAQAAHMDRRNLDKRARR